MKNVIIKHFNKTTGKTYLYWGHSTYIRGQKYPKVEKVSIGSIDEREEFFPNKSFLSFSADEQLATGLVKEPYLPLYSKASKETYETKMYGFTALLETAAKDTGVWNSLKRVYPLDWKIMLSSVESMMTYPSRALYSPKHFNDVCWSSNITPVSEPAITKALEAIDLNSKMRFFNELEKYTAKTEVEEIAVNALDTTSISTYSSMLESAKYGKNKEGDSLPQINLLMICNASTGIPMYYRMLSGNTSDKIVIDTTIKDLKASKFRKGVVLVLDRGFYAESNMKMLLSSNFTFLIGLPLTASIYTKAIHESIGVITQTDNYCAAIKKQIWSKDYNIEAPRRGRGKNSYDMEIYLFFDFDKQANEKKALIKKFSEDLERLRDNPSLAQGSNYYSKYFIIETKTIEITESNKETADTKKTKEIIVAIKSNIITQDERFERCGYFGFLGPKGIGHEKVLYYAKNRDHIEKDYEAFKTKMRRPRHSLEEKLESKIFLVFIATILEMRIRQKMDEYLLYRIYSFNSLRDEILSTKYIKPENKTFPQGYWDTFPLKVQKIFHIFKVVDDKLLNKDIDTIVHRELRKRKKAAGLID